MRLRAKVKNPRVWEQSQTIPQCKTSISIVAHGQAGAAAMTLVQTVPEASERKVSDCDDAENFPGDLASLGTSFVGIDGNERPIGRVAEEE